MEVKQNSIRKFKESTIPGSLKTTVWTYRINDAWGNQGKVLDILLVAKKSIFKSCEAPLNAAITPPI